MSFNLLWFFLLVWIPKLFVTQFLVWILRLFLIGSFDFFSEIWVVTGKIFSESQVLGSILLLKLLVVWLACRLIDLLTIWLNSLLNSQLSILLLILERNHLNFMVLLLHHVCILILVLILFNDDNVFRHCVPLVDFCINQGLFVRFVLQSLTLNLSISLINESLWLWVDESWWCGWLGHHLDSLVLLHISLTPRVFQSYLGHLVVFAWHLDHINLIGIFSYLLGFFFKSLWMILVLL